MVRNKTIFMTAYTDYLDMPIAWHKCFKDFHKHASKHTPVSSNVSSERIHTDHSSFFFKEVVV
jgi:hypothetical protein